MIVLAGAPERLARAVPLAPYTSLKVGGPADFFLAARSRVEIARARAWARDQGLPVRYLGGGSNLLIADDGVEGLVIRCVSSGESVDPSGQTVTVEAGVTFANLARRISRKGLGGLEWASNVPGTVGGAVVNNAGAFGGETARHLVSATILDGDGRERRMSVDDLGYTYRSSALKRRTCGDAVVLSADLRVVPSVAEECLLLIARYQSERTRSQPRQLSAGSVFANPPGDYSGRLIDGAGLKGAQEGGARVSPLHANFIVNDGGARATHVLRLMRRVRDAVLETSNVALQPEIEMLGRWTAEDLTWSAPRGAESGR